MHDADVLYAYRNLGEALVDFVGDIEPDMTIGPPDDPYLRRWVLRHSGIVGGLYVHQILKDDDDRALHDHPWDFDVFIVRGSYREIREGVPEGQLIKAGSYRSIVAETAHRLVVVDGPVWTLCFTGQRRREWGFHCPDRGWVHWKEYCDTRDSGLIGKGCEG